LDIEEPDYSSEYDSDLGEQANGERVTERRTLRTCWADLDPTPWAQVANQAAAATAVRRYHDALVAINALPAAQRESALAMVGDLTGQDIQAVASRVEDAARRAR
jgi:hypothetical protein